jgi:hypothetical protein
MGFAKGESDGPLIKGRPAVGAQVGLERLDDKVAFREGEFGIAWHRLLTLPTAGERACARGKRDRGHCDRCADHLQLVARRL